MFGSNRRLRLAAVGTAALLAAGGLLVVEAVSANAGGATRYVAKTGSDTDNDCTDIAHPCLTIQHGVDEASSNDTVSIGAGSYAESVQIRFSLTIVGAGATGSGKTTIDGDTEGGDPNITIDGSDADSTPVVTLRNLDVSGNTHNDGVLVNDAAVTVTDSVVSNNSSDGIQTENQTQLTVTGSTISGNSFDGVDASGLIAPPASVKPAVVTTPTVTLNNDTISGNTSSGVFSVQTDVGLNSDVVTTNLDGGAVQEGGTLVVGSSTFDSNGAAGVAVLGATATISNSTISNTNQAHQGGQSGLGAGLYVVESEVNATQSTFYRNTGQGVLSAEASVAVFNSTVANTRPEPSGSSFDLPNAGLANVNSTGGPSAVQRASGVFRQNGTASIKPQQVAASELEARGTVVAGTSAPDCSGTMTDLGYSLAGDASCAFQGAGSKNSGTTKLGPFGSNGGPTKTLVPLKGSSAIDQIPVGKAGCTATGTDQRGDARLQGAKCDIGAVEVAQSPVVISPASLPNGVVGTSYHVTFTATGGLGAPYVFSLASGSQLPAGLSLSSAGVLSGTPTAAGTYPFTISVDDPTVKAYSLVITGGTPPLANTGTAVASMLEWGGGAIALGVALLLGAGYAGRRRNQS